MRSAIKQMLIEGYCRGWIPACVVVCGFRIFRLGAS